MPQGRKVGKEMHSEKYIVVDVETTGMSTARGDRVIEIGAVAIERGHMCEEFTTLIRIEQPIHWAAQQVHGISADMLRDQPLPAEVWPQFAQFISGAVLIAHNASFDTGFIRHELSRCGLSLPNRSICTVQRSRRYLPKLANHRLETVARHLLGEIPTGTRMHRALDDARLTAQVWLALMKNS